MSDDDKQRFLQAQLQAQLLDTAEGANDEVKVRKQEIFFSRPRQ